MNSKKFINSNVLITLLTLVSVGINFLSQMILAYYFGANAERDAYFSAAVVPSYIVMLFTTSFSVIFLPYFISFRKNHGDTEEKKMISSTIGLYTLLLTFIAVVGYIFSSEIVSLIAPGFNSEQFRNTVALFNVLIFTIIFQGISHFFTIFHHIENRFIAPAFSPIIVSVFSLIFVIIFNGCGIISLAYGVLVGSAFSMFLLVPLVHRKIAPLYFFQFLNPHTISIFRLAFPLLISSSVYKLTVVIERVIASNLPSGSISYLGYGNQIYLLLATIASGSIATTFYPAMSNAWAEGDRAALNNYLSRAIRLILLITLPLAAIFIAIPDPIVKILFERGAFNAKATEAVAQILSILMGAFIFGSLGNVLVKIFYIAKKTTIISFVSILEVIAYLIIGYCLASIYSYLGLALALSISSGITIVFCFTYLLKSKFITIPNLCLDVIKLVTAAFLCGIAAYILFNLLDSANIWLVTVISILMSIIVYLIFVLFILKITDSTAIRSVIKNYF